MGMLTDKQAAVLEWIERFNSENGYPPTYQEMADDFGWKSRTAAVRHVEALVTKGFLKRPKKTRTRWLVPLKQVEPVRPDEGI